MPTIEIVSPVINGIFKGMAGEEARVAAANDKLR